jgi:AraC-like DNA-binding protein
MAPRAFVTASPANRLMSEPVQITRQAEVCPALEQLFPSLAVEVKRDDERPVLFDLRAAKLDGISVHAMNFTHAIRCVRRAQGETLSIGCQLSGSVSVVQGRARSPVEIAGSDCSIFWNREGSVIDVAENGSRLLVEVPEEVLERVVARHFGVEMVARPDFEPIVSAIQPANARLRQLAQTAMQCLLADSGAHAAVLARQFRDLIVTTLLLRVPNTVFQSLCKASTPAGSRYIRRALEFMEANLENPISIELIASAAGCSPRRLQLGFRDRIGVTPLAMLKKRRLEEAEKRLRSGQYSTVTEVAYSLSFGNPGRFAGEFAAKFGMPPAKLLRSSPTR